MNYYKKEKMMKKNNKVDEWQLREGWLSDKELSRLVSKVLPGIEE
jgi:hypothetical protein